MKYVLYSNRLIFRVLSRTIFSFNEAKILSIAPLRFQFLTKLKRKRAKLKSGKLVDLSIDTTATFFVLILLFSACTVEPKEINYGSDHCYHCDMTIVDKTHAAEYVTKKGKVHVFDAVECLIMKLNDEKSEKNMAFILVDDFNNPGHLTNAQTATYLITDKIKSPMGANISAFKIKTQADKIKLETDGELFTWEKLKQKTTN